MVISVKGKLNEKLQTLQLGMEEKGFMGEAWKEASCE